MELAIVIVIVVAAAAIVVGKLAGNLATTPEADAGAPTCGGQCGSCTPPLVELGGKPPACRERR